MDQSTTPYLEFKFLLNRAISLGNGVHYFIPTEFKEQRATGVFAGTKRAATVGMTQFGGMLSLSTPHEEATMVVPVFDMDHVHRVYLRDERPMIPPRIDGLSDAFYQKLCEDAYLVALENKRVNDAVRKNVASYVRNNVLEIVSDPFRPAAPAAEGSAVIQATESGQAIAQEVAPIKRRAKSRAKNQVVAPIPALHSILQEFPK